MINVDRVKRVLVVGSGVMGSSIAQVFAMGDVDVTLMDVDGKALTRAMGVIESGLKTLADFGKISGAKIPSILSRINRVTDLTETAGDVEFAIEVVPEVPNIKRKVLSQLGDLCAPETVIASNTSALDIFNIAEVKGPERLIISHFFSPAHIIPLVEIVPGARTSPETVSFTAALMEKLGKSPVVMKKYWPGFIGNRIQKAIGETVLQMIQEGVATPDEIDRAMKLTLGIRLPIVGVVQTFDFQGLDMLLDTMRNYGKVFGFIEEKVKKGHLGVKTSKGIYDYQGRKEVEILRKRDELYLKMLKHLEEIHAFDPV
ncbi:MAG: 3-hydroxyacyl-CoA dehydrogenase family protein [Deltaproteobacteria bacterium]|nr:3-hydroxyacyl-CoA dehydrogenase family protein [Deltaproteobacteria bacterium]